MVEPGIPVVVPPGRVPLGRAPPVGTVTRLFKTAARTVAVGAVGKLLARPGRSALAVLAVLATIFGGTRSVAAAAARETQAGQPLAVTAETMAMAAQLATHPNPAAVGLSLSVGGIRGCCEHCFAFRVGGETPNPTFTA